MNERIASEIQAEQDHGRQKYGVDAANLARDDRNTPNQWAWYISDHNGRARISSPAVRRQHLIKVAGLAVSAVEAIDRAAARAGGMPGDGRGVEPGGTDGQA